MNQFTPIQFSNGKLILLDQRQLPSREVFIEYDSIEGVYNGIKDMVVRGAPCIGFTAIFGMAIWIKNHPDFNLEQLIEAGNYLNEARPTAVNLGFEIQNVIEEIKKNQLNSEQAYERIVELGVQKIAKSEQDNRNMAKTAEAELDSRLGQKRYKILTHCNTGFLACGSVGTALGVVQNLHEKGKLENCWVDETRPYLQGSRLTAYELNKLNAPHKIVVEGAASFLMKNKMVDAIFTGADRIAANGDTANKIGTSNLAVLARYYNIPFYIVAPSSSFDTQIKSGEDIHIELRSAEEITKYNGQLIAPSTSEAYNPSFDITDGELITGIISEKGIASGHYQETLKAIL